MRNSNRQKPVESTVVPLVAIAGHIIIHYLAALHRQTTLQVMCFGAQTQKTNHHTFSVRGMTLKGCVSQTVCLRVQEMECVPVCLQSTAGSPLTLKPALENQVRVTADSTHSALCIQTIHHHCTLSSYTSKCSVLNRKKLL